jgi:hypothetical protein
MVQGQQDMVTMVACMGGTTGQLVLSGARDGSIALYDVRAGTQAATFAVGAMVGASALLHASLRHSGSVSCRRASVAAASSSGDALRAATCGSNAHPSGIYAWRLSRGTSPFHR